MRYLVSKQIKPVLGSSSLETATGILYSFTQKLVKTWPQAQKTGIPPRQNWINPAYKQ